MQVICTMWVHTSMFCAENMLCLCKPPEGNIASLTMGSIGVEDLVLISCTYKSLVRQTQILYGLGVPWWACCCQFIQTTATQKGASCLLISTAVFSSSLAQPQARATSSTGSEVVMSHTVSSHSTRHCGQLHQRQWWPAQRQRVHFLFHSSYCLPSWLPAMCQWKCKDYLFSAKNINRKGIFPPAFQKWMEFSCRISDL